MNITFKPNKLKASTLFFSILSLVALFYYVITFIPIRLNTTSSVKKGLYTIEKPTAIISGDYIAFCLSDKLANIAQSNGYIAKGECPNNSQPLLKKVIATPGDIVTINNEHVEISHTTSKNSYFLTTFKNDLKGNQIPKTTHNGTKKINGFWVIGDNNMRSWDSRYFGEISKESILYKAHALLVF